MQHESTVEQSVLERLFVLPGVNDCFFQFFENSCPILSLRRVNCNLYHVVIRNLTILTIRLDLLHHLQDQSFPLVRELNILQVPIVIERKGKKPFFPVFTDDLDRIVISAKQFPSLISFKCVHNSLEELYIEESIKLKRFELSSATYLEKLQLCCSQLLYINYKIIYWLIGENNEEKDRKHKRVSLLFFTFLKQCKQLVEACIEGLYISDCSLPTLFYHNQSISVLHLHAFIFGSDNTLSKNEDINQLKLPSSLEECKLELFCYKKNQTKLEIVYEEELESIYFDTNFNNASLIFESKKQFPDATFNEVYNMPITTNSSSLSKSSLKMLTLIGSESCICQLWQRMINSSSRPQHLESFNFYFMEIDKNCPQTMTISNFFQLTHLQCSLPPLESYLFLENLPQLKFFSTHCDIDTQQNEITGSLFLSGLHALDSLVLENATDIVVQNMDALKTLRINYFLKHNFRPCFFKLRQVPALEKLWIVDEKFWNPSILITNANCPHLNEFLCFLPQKMEETEQLINLLRQCCSLEKLVLIGRGNHDRQNFDQLFPVLENHASLSILELRTFSIDRLCFNGGFHCLQQLTILDIGNTSVEIKHLPQLCQFSVQPFQNTQSSPIQNRVLLQTLPKLKHIRCNTNDLILVDLPKVQSFTEFNQLNSFVAKGLSTLSYLNISAAKIEVSDIPNLEQATFNTIPKQDTTLSLNQVPMLHTVFIQGFDTFKIYDHLHNVKLENVWITTGAVGEALKFLTQCTSLTRINLTLLNTHSSDCSIQVQNFINQLSSCPTLKELFLNIPLSEPIIMSSGYIQLEKLVLYNLQCVEMSNLPQLKTLKFISFFEQQVSLRSLYLHPFLSLSSLHKLSEVTVYAPDLISRMMIEIKDLPNLLSLEPIRSGKTMYEILFYDTFTPLKISKSSHFVVSFIEKK